MDRVNILPNQRVGIPDYEDGAGGKLVQADQIREGRVFLLPSGRTVGNANTSARILGGFNFDTIVFNTDQSATLNRGKGIFPFLDDDNNLIFGLLQGEEGSSSIILDFSGVPASSTQAVYVRLVSTPGQTQNRVFWNPSGAPAAEFVDNVATRLELIWEAAFQDSALAPPGNGEWVKIWEVVMDGSTTIDSITDYRHFYFEGDARASYPDEWGSGANDRDSDRAQYGVTDQHMWVQAVRRQLAGLLGDSWWTAAATSVKSLYPIQDRFVTVDINEAGGGDGAYATLAAAITGVSAGNGGTILLRKGTYEITTQMTLTKKTQIIAVEEGVVIENEVSASSSNFMFIFSSTCAGSGLHGVTISEGSTPSDNALDIQCELVNLIGCDITGWIRYFDSQNSTIQNCILRYSTGTAGNTATLSLTGLSTIDVVNCKIYGKDRDNTILINMSATPVSGIRSKASIKNSTIHAETARGIDIFSGEQVAVEDCFIYVHIPPNDSDINIGLRSDNSGGLVSIRNVFVNVNNTGAAFTNPVVKLRSGDATNVIEVDGLYIELGDNLPTFTVYSDAPVHLRGYAINIRNMQIMGIKIPNVVTQAYYAGFVEIHPDNELESKISIKDSRFLDITGEAGSSNAAIIGCRTGSTAAGSILLENITIDGSSMIVTGGNNRMLNFNNTNLTKLWINNCKFEGGWWERIVNIDGPCVFFSNNRLSFTDLATDLTWIAYIVGHNTAVTNSMCVYHNNILFRKDITASSAVRIEDFDRASIIGNIETSLGSSPPASGGLRAITNNKVVVYANLIDDGITLSTNVAEKPDGVNEQVADHNFVV
jgi:hypothetical protein